MSSAVGRLRLAEYGDLLATTVLIPLIHAGVRVFDFQRIRRFLERRSARPHRAPRDTRATIDHAVRALGRARRYGPYAGNCLSQSLALWWRLRRQGVETDLCLGARRSADQLDAHAWVEHAGVVLNDTQDVATRYAPLLPR